MNVRYPFLLIVDIPYTQVLVHPNLQAVFAECLVSEVVVSQTESL